MVVHKHVPVLRVYKSVCGKLGTTEEPCTHDWSKVTCEDCLVEAKKCKHEKTDVDMSFGITFCKDCGIGIC